MYQFCTPGGFTAPSRIMLGEIIVERKEVIAVIMDKQGGFFAEAALETSQTSKMEL